MAVRSLLTAVGVVLLALWIHALYDFGPLDTYFPPETVNSTVETHFAETYYQARAQFRARAKAANADLVTLSLEHLVHLELTIDVAVLEGSKKRVVLHISGTHGVEGFAGSAIQSALLQRLAGVHTSGSSTEKPTIIFVHALNPYGFSQLRRFNEHNVDLNRNFLKPEEFAARRARDSNEFGYDDVYTLLNPSPPLTWKAWLDTKIAMVTNLFTHGVSLIKLAVVSGNYHHPKSIFYGGKQLQPGPALLKKFLQERLDLEALKLIGTIDIHTGLGAPGVDTLILKQGTARDMVQSVYPNGNVEVNGEEGSGAASGYGGAAGFLCNGMAWFIPSQVQQICATQEFGTSPGPLVLQALSNENAMYHFAPSRRLPYAEKLRDVFYLHRSFQWKRDVLARGLEVFDQLVAHVGSAKL